MTLWGLGSRAEGIRDMTLLLSAVDGVLTGKSPIVGSPAEAEAGARTLSRMAEELNNSYFTVGQAVTCLTYVRSRAVSKVSDGVNSRFLDGAALLSDDLTISSNALSSYSAEIDRIHISAREIVGEVGFHLGHIQGCASEMNLAAATLQLSTRSVVPSDWAQKPSPWPPLTTEVLEDLAPSQLAVRTWATGVWAARAISWGWATDRIHECQSRWARLILDRKQAEAGLAAKLRGTTLGPFLSFAGSSSRAGVTRMFTGGRVHRSRFMSDPLLEYGLGGNLTPQEVAENWKALGLSTSEIGKLPIEVLFVLAQSDGVPYEAQDIAANISLTYAIEHPKVAIRMMGLTADLSETMFVEQLTSIKQAYDDAKRNASLMPGSPSVQLFHFGVHDGALTAAISIGNLDNASNIGVIVPGMGSDVNGLPTALGGAEQIYLEAVHYDSRVSPAVVAWIGYRAPGMPPSLEVLHGERAASGAKPLANFIDGLNAVRVTGGEPMQEFAVLAHSYGATTAAEALKVSETKVDSFVTYGSAGLEAGTTLKQLQTDHMYATSATGDDVAWAGVMGSGRVNPIDIPGVVEFGSEEAGGRVRVTAHDMFTEDKRSSLWNWGGKIGYLSEGTTSVEALGRVLAGGAP